MMSFLFNVFQELSLSAKVLDEANSLYRPAIRNDQLDSNNNIDMTGPRAPKSDPGRFQQTMSHTSGADIMSGKSRGFRVSRVGCSSRKYCTRGCSRSHQNKSKRKGCFPTAKRSLQTTEFVENSLCNCSSSLGCNIRSNCDYRCCNGDNQHDLPPMVMKRGTEQVPPIRNNVVNSTVPSKNGQNGVGAIHSPRKLLDEDKRGSYRSRDMNNRYSGVENEGLDDAATLQEYITELDWCKQLIDKHPATNGPCGIPVRIYPFCDTIIAFY
ncbi:uncharacterized protein LOC143260807 [Megalopta genalis]|uniref:uncharacterized protein LOC143260807 n=1 Tax=Megalopta genalis TaxID=115081 RepID=UPI003FCF8854